MSLDPQTHTFSQGYSDVQTHTQKVFGGFWKTRDVKVDTTYFRQFNQHDLATYYIVDGSDIVGVDMDNLSFVATEFLIS